MGSLSAKEVLGLVLFGVLGAVLLDAARGWHVFKMALPTLLPFMVVLGAVSLIGIVIWAIGEDQGWW